MNKIKYQTKIERAVSKGLNGDAIFGGTFEKALKKSFKILYKAIEKRENEFEKKNRNPAYDYGGRFCTVLFNMKRHAKQAFLHRREEIEQIQRDGSFASPELRSKVLDIRQHEIDVWNATYHELNSYHETVCKGFTFNRAAFKKSKLNSEFIIQPTNYKKVAEKRKYLIIIN